MLENVREQDTRTAALLGDGACDVLKSARVAVFGVGGVGGNLCEALARAGIGHIDLFDGDRVTLSNINRQVIALHSTVGMPKVEAMKKRISDINPECVVNTFNVFYLPENADLYPLDTYDYIADAIDTVSAKVELAARGQELGVPVISAMGAGNKLDGAGFCVADIYETQVCPLAKSMRKLLKARGVTKLKTVYSKEIARKNDLGIIGSVSFVPPVVGLIMAGEIVKDILKKSNLL